METTNKINLEVFIPVLVFYVISEKLPSITNIGYFSLGAFLVILGSGIISYPVSRMLGLNARTFLPPMMFGNSINLGFPLALLGFGEKGLAMFVSLSLIQVMGQFTVAAAMYGGMKNFTGIIKNPVILSAILGLIFNYYDIHFPKIIITPLKMMAQVSIPLVLFALGVRLVHIEMRHWKIGLVGAILGPLSGVLVAILVIHVFHYTPMQASLLVMFGALPPAVLNAIMAEQQHRDSSMVASVVAMGNVFALIIIPLVLYFILPS